MVEENIVEKVEIAQNEQFHLFSHNVFYAISTLKSFKGHSSFRLQLLGIWDGLKNGVLGNVLITEMKRTSRSYDFKYFKFKVKVEGKMFPYWIV